MTKRLYSGKDFDTIRSEVISRLDRAFPDVTFDFENDLINVIVDAIAFSVEGANFYQDVQANEIYLETAQLPSTLDRIAAENAYNPKGAASASGELRVRPSDPVTNITLMPKGFQWQASNGYVYETQNDHTWQPGSQDWKILNLSQGETVEQVFRSDGTRFQRFDIQGIDEGQSMAQGEVTVEVDGTAWEEKDAFLDTHTDVFRVAYTADPPYIEFGDGAVGTIPPEGTEIRVQFKLTRGRDGVVPTGQFSGPVEPLVAAGETVPFDIDASTGQMTGGAPPESLRTVRGKVPNATHADNAVVTPPDFEGLVKTFRDPVYGAVAAVSVTLATGVDNDLETVDLLSRIRSEFNDADAIVDTLVSDFQSLQSDLNGYRTAIDTAISNLQTILESGGDVAGLIGEVTTSRESATSNIDSLETSNESIKTASQDADSLIDTIDSELNTLQSNAGSNSSSDFDTAISKAQELKTQVKGSGPIQSNAGGISSTISSLRGNVNMIKTKEGELDTKRDEAHSEVATIDTEAGNIATFESTMLTRTQTFEANLTDPWDNVNGWVDDLEDHLDDVFADPCGPNLLTVPVLVHDADRFYVAPSIGLLDSLEQYLNDRKEPSVEFNVIDGSIFLVEPEIEVTFEIVRGFSPSNVKDLLESEILGLLRDREFGRDMNLDDLYDNVTTNQREKGIASVNLVVTGFDAGPNSSASIDNDGNLKIGDREVITRGDLTFYRRFPNGQKQQV